MSMPPHRLRFFHGLGDVVLFRNVLQHLEGPIDLFLNPELGQAGLFHQDQKIRVVSQVGPHDDFRNVRFEMEFSKSCRSGKATKARICLEHEFDLFLPNYQICPLPITDLGHIQSEAVEKTSRFLDGIGPFVVCHFQGTSNPPGQNPDTDFANRFVSRLLKRGWDVVMINYDYVFHHPNNGDFAFVDNHRVRSTYRRLPMEVESLWTLISRAAAFYGVDSGPLHLALCSQTPCTYIQFKTGFLENFYDTGLDRLTVIDAHEPWHCPIPDELIPSLASQPISSAQDSSAS